MEFAKIRVTETCVEIIWVQDIPSGTVGGTVSIEYAHPAWNALMKTAVFRGCESKDVLNIGTNVTIPPEVVEKPSGALRFGIYGVNPETGDVSPTFWVALGHIRPGADPSGDTSTDPTLPVWAQLQADIEKLKLQGGGKSGIPPGGKAGQILYKMSDDDYDVAWQDLKIPEQYGLVTYDQNRSITIT